ncbi:MAG: UvrB/UvrC motif-containing protein [Candidatus Sumerlaeota bacterium]|nr:UvrB/UvrC motif-containing protein [Candidatus Sumerlaeota bacterium]
MTEPSGSSNPEERDLDLSRILEGWDYTPGEVIARKVRGRDGREKIQMRLALGVIQMEAEGRPDGQRPHGCATALEYFQDRLDQHRLEHGGDEGFSLSPEECEELRDEGLVYYYRYLCLFQLKDFAAVARDTRRNLRMADFLNAHAPSAEDRWSSEQYRPYILMMNVRAEAYLALERNQVALAIRKARTAIETIREFYARVEREFAQLDAATLIENSSELRILQTLEEEIRRAYAEATEAAAEARKEDGPTTTIEALRRQLRQAIEAEDYERAAVLRDQIRALRPT